MIFWLIRMSASQGYKKSTISKFHVSGQPFIKDVKNLKENYSLLEPCLLGVPLITTKAIIELKTRPDRPDSADKTMNSLQA